MDEKSLVHGLLEEGRSSDIVLVVDIEDDDDNNPPVGDEVDPELPQAPRPGAEPQKT